MSAPPPLEYQCPQCRSKNTRKSMRRFYDWAVLPALVPRRCRDCRARFYQIRGTKKTFSVRY